MSKSYNRKAIKDNGEVINITEVLKEIISKLNWSESDPVERNNKIRQLLGEKDTGNLHKDIQAYIETHAYHSKYVGVKNGINGDPLSEQIYFNKKLEKLVDYIISKYENNPDSFFWNHTVLKQSRIDQDRSDRENKKIIGLNVNVIDDFNSSVPETVLNGLELHADYLESYTSKSDKDFRLSEEQKLKRRKQEVKDNLDKFPSLKVNYDIWKDIGLKYGLDIEEYSQDERKELESYWLSEFAKEDHEHSPKQRLYLLNHYYNSLGYELSLLLNNLKDTITPHKQNQYTETVDYDSVIDNTVDLSQQKHVVALLSISYQGNEYFPLYVSLKQKYEDKIDSGIYHLLHDFENAIEHTDFSEMQKDILELILNEHKSYNIYLNGSKDNPYKGLRKYINENYKNERSKANIINIIESQIAKLIANTYQDIQDGVPFKKCIQCTEEKLGNNDNYGADKRNADKLKSVCRKCNAKNEKKREKVLT
ncbi:hypothetical protein [Radiobacillus sp. PE A8.2]|uniref:hypothetical protein n=1 Tax=Radiobacillus sp. PE A8.2 TaxID=3380349 RepID=UPI0038906A10